MSIKHVMFGHNYWIHPYLAVHNTSVMQKAQILCDPLYYSVHEFCREGLLGYVFTKGKIALSINLGPLTEHFRYGWWNVTQIYNQNNKCGVEEEKQEDSLIQIYDKSPRDKTKIKTAK